MRYFVFDTETNGLPQKYTQPPTFVENWPHAVEIAWEIRDYCNNNNYVVKKNSFYIKTRKNMKWSSEAEKIHKISQETLENKGIDIKECLKRFQEDLLTCDVVFAHNFKFDFNIINCEAFREKMIICWPSYSYCTATKCAELVKIPLKNRYLGLYKYPKLGELHSFLIPDNSDFDAHTAAGDVKALGECTQKLFENGYISHDSFCA